MVEYIAEHDDAVLDKYLTEGTLGVEEMRQSVRQIHSGVENRSRSCRLRFQEQGHSALA